VNAVNRQTVARKLEYLRKQLELLEPYRALPKEQLLGDIEKRLTVERLLELSIQSVIDCSRLIVAIEDWRGVRDEREALRLLAERQVISMDLGERLLRAKGFRNVLVHDYVEIDPELLYAHLHDDVGDLWDFAGSLAKILSLGPSQ
jgi:uncharacterized protein YutE (UPF0331/DUF86 family)